MAILEVMVPQLSESVAEATLLQWHKKVGEAVARDENLIDIETDKVVLELPAPAAGVIVEIIKPDGSKLSKSAGDTGIGELRAAGVSAAEVLGEAAVRAGLLEVRRPIAATDLPSIFEETAR